MATAQVAEIEKGIRKVTEILSSLEPGDPDTVYYRAILQGFQRRLADTQSNGNAQPVSDAVAPSVVTQHSYQVSSASRKRSLGAAEVPEAKRVSANPSPTAPGTPDVFPAATGQAHRILPSRSIQVQHPAIQPPFVDLTQTFEPNLHQNDLFPELNDAFRNDGRLSPADAFKQEWMSETELASFLVNPDPASGPIGFQQQQSLIPTNQMMHHRGLQMTSNNGSQGPYLNYSRWPGVHGSDSDEDDYGDFPLDASEAKSIEAMLETVQQNDDDAPEYREQTPRIMKSQLKEYQKIGLTWLLKMEDGRSKGGILADEMGLGKTVQALALICARPSQDPLRKTTLIVAPVALLRQWEKEIAHHVLPRHRLYVYMYHGGGKKADFNVLRQYDVVLATFGTLTSEYKQKEARIEVASNKDGTPRSGPRRKGKGNLSLLGRECMWYRIILDEAHNIKNRNSKCSKAASELQARHRLCMTGTPMMNSIDELYPLLRFLRADRYSDWRIFSQDIARPVKNRQEYIRKKAMNRVQVLLKVVMLRRQKTSVVDGQPILQLPPKHLEIDNVDFSDDEHAFYKALEAKSQIQFNKYLKTNSVDANYASILVLILRLRQACCHPHLIKDLSQPATENISVEDLLERASNLPEDVVARLRENDSFECPICLEADPNPTIIIPCGHTVCGICVQKLIDPAQAAQEASDESNAAKCPQCRGDFEAKLITDYKHFCRVFCPERLPSEDRLDQHEEEEDESDNDSETDSDDEDESEKDEIDDEGNLADFIVPDEDEDDDPVKSEKDFGSEDSSYEAQADKKATAKKEKGKGKAKKKARAKSKQTLAQLKKESLRSKAARKKYIRRLEKGWVSSAKIEQLVTLLSDINKKDPSEKTLVFSQFTSLLDLIEVPLLQKKFRYQRYDGSMSMEARADAVEVFMENPEENIMLVSLKAGNAGLNLSRASQVIIIDPFWNPFVEDQAVDRAHRMPQEREVTVHRILVQETVEDRICALQDKKRDIIGQALDEQAAKSLTRLGIQELKYLFGVK